MATMARPDQEKCRLCSKLTTQEAQQRHGAAGDGCWDPKHCHNRRSYYRHRGVRNQGRKQRRQQQEGDFLSSQVSSQTSSQASSQASLQTSSQASSRSEAASLEVAGTAKVARLEISVPAVPAAVVHWYRATKDFPLHALGAEFWLGNQRVAKIEPVHCLGLTETQVKTLLVQILERFSQHSGMKVERFRSAVELHPDNCPIRPCPLYPDVER